MIRLKEEIKAKLKVLLGLVSLFNEVSKFVGYFMPNHPFKRTVMVLFKWYFLTHNWANKVFHTFPKNVSLKVNVIVQPEFEIAYLEVAVQYGTRTPAPCIRAMRLNNLIW